MTRTLICYSGNSRAYVRWLSAGRPADTPNDVPFVLPYDASKGDRYLLFVGSEDKAYVGSGTVVSEWKKGTGGWRGHWQIRCDDRMFREPVPADAVRSRTRFNPPTGEMIVPEELSSAVWQVATGKKLIPVDLAVEGILTETRSRRRDPGLRLAALQRAKGRCECCGTNFARRAGGLGARCLVVHHKKQIRDYDQPRETELSDLAVVCANCHMMIHANPARALTISQLRSRLAR